MKVENLTIKRDVITVVEEEVVSITLTQDEAAILKAVVGCIGGYSPELAGMDVRKEFTDNFWVSLDEVIDDEHPKHREARQSLRHGPWYFNRDNTSNS